MKKTWDSFRGVNTTLRDSELKDDQVRELTNLVIEGKGTATQRPGTGAYFTAGASGKVRGLIESKIDETKELLALTDTGYLAKKSGTSYELISGASWASGMKLRGVQLQNKVWLVQEGKPLVRYDGTTLLSYTTISAPTSLAASKLSGATGTFTWSWRVAATTDAGSTLASDPISLSYLPEDLAEATVRLAWTPGSGATPYTTGYVIYGRESGAQSRLAGVQPDTLVWLDDGSANPSQIAFLPDYNETGGPEAKFVIKSVGKIVLGRLTNAKSRIQWSGADVNVGRFHWTKGGGYTDFDKDDGDELMGISEAEENRVVGFKRRSIHQAKLEYSADLGIVEATKQLVTAGIGCLSGDTIVRARNNTYFVGQAPGGEISLYSLGYEPQILANVLRTAVLSEVVKSTLEAANLRRAEDMWMTHFDDKLWWFFPTGSGDVMSCLVYDLERTAFMGPMTFPKNAVNGLVYYDENEEQQFLLGGADGEVVEVSSDYSSDSGTDFQWTLTSKKELFDLPFKLKTMLYALIHLSDVSGDVSVQVIIEDVDGNTATEASFSVSGTSTLAGGGSFPWGYLKRWGSSQQAGTSTTNSSDIRRYIQLNTPDVVSVQVKIQGTGSRAKIQTIELQSREQAGLPSAWSV